MSGIDPNKWDSIIDAQEPAPDPNRWDSVIEDQIQKEQQDLWSGAALAVQTNPDKYAQLRDVSRALEMDPSVLGHTVDTSVGLGALEHAKSVDALNKMGLDKFYFQTPTVATWLANIENMKLSHDDVATGHFWKMVEALGAGGKQVKQSFLINDMLDAGLDPDLDPRIKELGDSMERTARSIEGDSFAPRIVQKNLMILPAMAETLGIGAGVGAVAGASAVAVGAAPLAAPAAGVGMALGTGYATAKLEQASAYLQYVHATKQRKQGVVDHADLLRAKQAAQVVGAINGVIEVGGFALALKFMPGLSMLFAEGAPKIVLQKSIRRLVAESIMGWAGELVSEAGQEGIQAGVTTVGETFVTGESVDIEGTGRIMLDEFKGGLEAMALTTGAGAGLSGMQLFRQRAAGEYNKRKTEEYARLVVESKLAGRAPDKIGELADLAVEDGHPSTVYLGTDEFTKLFQDKGIGPTEAAEGLGFGQEFADAVRQGTDIAIPFNTYLSKVANSEYHTGMIGDLKFGPDDMSAKEMEAFDANLKELKKTLDDLKGKQPGETPDLEATPSYTSTKSMLLKSGRPESEAHNLALIKAAFDKTMGVRNNVDVLTEFPLIVTADDAPVSPQLSQPVPVQTDTPQFKSWFKDSKIVDDAGQPIVVWHGSPRRFETFDLEQAGSRTDQGYLGRGFYFGTKQHAALYANLGLDRDRLDFATDEDMAGGAYFPVGKSSALYPVHLSIQNPLVLNERKDHAGPYANVLGYVGNRQVQDRELHIREELGLPREATSQQVTEAAKARGYDGVVFNHMAAAEGGLGDREFVAFDPEQIKSSMGNSGAFDPSDKSILRQRPLPSTDSPQFKSWFAESKVVDEDGKPKIVYHGTVTDLGKTGIFLKDKANPESDFGAGFYFTDSEDDVVNNYADEEGPDIKSRIERLAEQIQGQSDKERTYEQALKLATKLIVKGRGEVFQAYLSFQNPLVVGGENETRLEMTQETDEEGEFTGEATGTLIDFAQALMRVSNRYDGIDDIQQLISEIYEAADYESIGAKKLGDIIRDSEVLTYAEDENGKLVSHEVMREAFEEAGFDGIIDHTVFDKFGRKQMKSYYREGMAGLERDTTHYIAFHNWQIKSSDRNSGDYDKTNPSIFYQRVFQGSKASELAGGRWDDAYIGEGENTMGQGAGHYFSSKKSVAEWYRAELTGVSDPTTTETEWIESDPMPMYYVKKEKLSGAVVDEKVESSDDVSDMDEAGKIAIDFLIKAASDYNYYEKNDHKKITDEAIRNLQESILWEQESIKRYPPGTFPDVDKEIALLEEAIGLLASEDVNVQIETEEYEQEVERESEEFGNVFVAEIPDDHNLAHWDEPIKEQPDQVHERLMKSKIWALYVGDLETPYSQDITLKHFYDIMAGHFMRTQTQERKPGYGFAPRAAKMVSSMLREAGIPGHTYISKSGNKNFVIYDTSQIEPLTTLYQRVFQGSPAPELKGGRWSSEFIGSGEDTAGQGWGHYFTSKKAVAEWYRRQLSPLFRDRGNTVLYGDPWTDATAKNWSKEQRVAADWLLERENESEALAAMDDRMAQLREDTAAIKLEAEVSAPGSLNAQSLGRYIDANDRALSELHGAMQQIKSGAVSMRSTRGSVFVAEIPDDDKLMNWDEPLSKQPQPVQDALARSGILARVRADLLASKPSPGHAEERSKWADKEMARVSMKSVYMYVTEMERLLINQDEGRLSTLSSKQQQLIAMKRTSDMLIAAGIPGHTYISKSGNKNFVIYDDSAIDPVPPVKSTPATKLMQAAYHGSPHHFSRFSTKFIGKGEGHAAFGWGLYFSSSQGVAEYYQKALADMPSVSVGGVDFTEQIDKWGGAGAVVAARLSNRKKIVLKSSNHPPGFYGPNVVVSDAAVIEFVEEDLRGALWSANNDPEGDIYQAESLQRQVDVLERMKAEGIEIGKGGHVYKVELPSDDQLLDWRKPLSKQNDAVKRVVRVRLKELGYLRQDDNGPRQLTSAWKAYLATVGIGGDNGSTIYGNLLGGDHKPEEVSKSLVDAGIPGHIYEGLNSKEKNYVIYDDGVIDEPVKLYQKTIPKVASPEFKQWFAGSVVVNKVGAPKRMFHSTSAEFKDFRIGSHFGTANAANDRAATLNDFSVNVVGREPDKSHVIPVFLSIKNPLRMPDLASLYETDRGEVITEDDVAEAVANGEFRDSVGDEGQPRPMSWESETDLSTYLRTETDLLDGEVFWDVQYSPEKAMEHLKTLGYDGIVYNNAIEDPGNDSYVIFDPGQVESAFARVPVATPPEPSKLFQPAAAKTRTPEFKAWFGDYEAQYAYSSKRDPLDRPPSLAVHRENGKLVPTVMYHGTALDITEFKKKRQGGLSTWAGPQIVPRYGVFVAEDPKLAEIYATSHGIQFKAGPALMPVYIYAAGPIDLREPLADDQIEEIANAADQWLKTHASPIYESGQGMKFALDLSRNTGPNVWQMFDEGEGTDPKMLIAVLKRLGYDSAKMNESVADDEDVNPTSWVVFDPWQVKSAVANEGSFRSDTGNILKQPARGSITLMADGRPYHISLGTGADMSTFLHELGHMFIDVTGRVAQLPTASEQTKADYQAALEFMGYKTHQERIDSLKEIGRLASGGGDEGRLNALIEREERWARGFESVLMEGKAPSPEMVRPFARFTRWLTQIYRKIENLKVVVPEDIKQVMRRMIATDEQISQVEAHDQYIPMFENAKEAGMTEERFARYQQIAEEAHLEAYRNVELQLKSQKERETKSWWKEEQDKLRGPVTEQIDANPSVRAATFLRDGTLPDDIVDSAGLLSVNGKPAKLSAQALDEMYGPMARAIKRKLGPGTFVKVNGVHPDNIAPAFGFSSGDAMVRAITEEESRAKQIVREIDRRMVAAHGDILKDGTIESVSRDAIHESAGHLKMLQAELDAMSRQAGTPVVKLSKKVLQGYAEQQISTSTIRQVDPNRYLQAERKAATEAIKATRSGKFPEAIEWQKKRMINRYLYSAAKEVKRKSDAGIKFLVKQDSVKARQALGLMDTIDPVTGDVVHSYLQQQDKLLERYELRKVSGTEVKARQSLAAWIQIEKDANRDPVVPQHLLDEAQRMNYADMKVSDFLDLVDTVKNIKKQADRKRRLKVGAEEVMFDAFVEQGAAQIAEFGGRSDPTRVSAQNKTWTERSIYDNIQALDAELVRLREVANQLDGDDPNGLFHRILIHPLDDAAVKEHEMAAEMGRLFEASLKRLTPRQRAILASRETITIQSIGESLLLSDVITIAANTGNASNEYKLVTGWQTERQGLTPWNEKTLDEIKAQLTEEHWDLVQDWWNALETLWPEAKALEKRMTGLEPKKVEAKPFVYTRPDGTTKTYDGGYFPVIYDPRFSGRNLQAPVGVGGTLYAPNQVRAITPHGHLEERVENYARPISTKMENVVSHVNSVIHDTTHREALVNAWRFMSDQRIADAMMRHMGEAYYRMVLERLRRVAQARNQPSAFLGAVHRVQGAVSAAMMGWKMSVALQNFANVVLAKQAVGTVPLAKAAIQYAGSPRKMTETITSLSGLMRNRMQQRDNELRQVYEDMISLDSSKRKRAQKEVIKMGYRFMAMTNAFSEFPAWLAEFQNAQARGLTEQESVRAADDMVVSTFGGGTVHDLAAVQDTEGMRPFTMFYGFFSAVYNMTRKAKRTAGKQWRSGQKAKAVSGALEYVMWNMVVMNALSELFSGRGPDDDPDEDTGERVKNVAEWLIAKGAGYGFAMVPFLRDAWRMVDSGRRDAQITPLTSIVTEVGRTGQAIANAGIEIANADEVDAEMLAELGGNIGSGAIKTWAIYEGMPVAQFNITAGFLWDWMVNENAPENWSEGVHDLLYTKPRERR